jgi:hypothetical protein
VFIEVRRGGSDSVVLVVVGLGGEAELPTSDPIRDEDLVIAADFDSGRRKDPTVVCATGSGAVRVDGASVVYEHRAVPSLVVAEKQVTAGRPGGGKQQLGGYMGERVGLFWSDVNELGRRATGSAAAARHVRPAFTANCAPHLDQPGRELARCQVALASAIAVGHGFSGSSGRRDRNGVMFGRTVTDLTPNSPNHVGAGTDLPPDE